jgi:hypothetical protein
VDVRAEELLKEKAKKRKFDDKLNKTCNSEKEEEIEEIETNPNEYEKLLRKHEADIRNYIMVIFCLENK